MSSATYHADPARLVPGQLSNGAPKSTFLINYFQGFPTPQQVQTSMQSSYQPFLPPIQQAFNFSASTSVRSTAVASESNEIFYKGQPQLPWGIGPSAPSVSNRSVFYMATSTVPSLPLQQSRAAQVQASDASNFQNFVDQAAFIAASEVSPPTPSSVKVEELDDDELPFSPGKQSIPRKSLKDGNSDDDYDDDEQRKRRAKRPYHLLEPRRQASSVLGSAGGDGSGEGNKEVPVVASASAVNLGFALLSCEHCTFTSTFASSSLLLDG